MQSNDVQQPNVKDGIDYWNSRPASVDGVLGGFGTGSLPRVDALGSRLFLLSLIPQLSIVPSAIRPLNPLPPTRRTRAVDVGAGVGRVTSSVLLHLVQDVVLVEPVDNFVREALARASATEHLSGEWKGLLDKRKSVTVLQGTLQDFDPSKPITGSNATLLGRVGYSPPDSEHQAEDESGFDVIWCQWCLGHLSDPDLVEFFLRARKSLRSAKKGTGDFEGLIIVKENTCSEKPPGTPTVRFDAQDSSLTRSDNAWKAAFREAGLTLLKEETQLGLTPGLYPVKMYALR
ncbi:hypothetical protein BD410DRAFT_60326 [Rickenella mellea]|uniref:Alpha N-terminal protein methyltransferase 1 n=1 Tax=Rickenella mellea TaxID=50990 RepID=A0A4Y7QBE4_9AGAM|nr:hypothetical protein BD410DRAFT_60326 [Rickenella mellea]